MTTTDTPRPVHEGRNLKRIREMLQVKQASLAQELGGDWNQKKISQLEDKDVIDPQILDEVAKALKVSPEAIKNFDEQAAVNIISNTFTDNNYSAVGYIANYHPSFHPLEELMKTIDENKKLYERLLQAEKEKVDMLERILSERR